MTRPRSPEGECWFCDLPSTFAGSTCPCCCHTAGNPSCEMAALGLDDNRIDHGVALYAPALPPPLSGCCNAPIRWGAGLPLCTKCGISRRDDFAEPSPDPVRAAERRAANMATRREEWRRRAEKAEAERDSFRNGQRQLQDTVLSLMAALDERTKQRDEAIARAEKAEAIAGQRPA